MTYNRSTWKLSKLGILIIYPVLNFALPLVIFGVFGLQISRGEQVGGDLRALLATSQVFTVGLLVLVAFYLVDTFKNKTFAKTSDGNRKADVGDYFALFFSVLAIGGAASTMLTLLT